jgi:hypothetical protein
MFSKKRKKKMKIRKNKRSQTINNFFYFCFCFLLGFLKTLFFLNKKNEDYQKNFFFESVFVSF